MVLNIFRNSIKQSSGFLSLREKVFFLDNHHSLCSEAAPNLWCLRPYHFPANDKDLPLWFQKTDRFVERFLWLDNYL